jgi:hypothetical protein
MPPTPLAIKWEPPAPKAAVRNSQSEVESLSLEDDVRKLAADILSDSTVRERLAVDWWNDNPRQAYTQKFIESDTQFDIEFAQRISNIFSRLDAKSVDTNPAREQFKNHDLVSLGFTLEAIGRKLDRTRDRTLSPQDRQFLVYRFGLNARGFHNPQAKVDFDSTMLVHADFTCKECERFAEQLRRCAKDAKWAVNPYVEPSPPDLSNQKGVIVHGNADGPGGEPGLWLSKMGFEVNFDSHKYNSNNPWEISIFVGKP